MTFKLPQPAIAIPTPLVHLWVFVAVVTHFRCQNLHYFANTVASTSPMLSVSIQHKSTITQVPGVRSPKGLLFLLATLEEQFRSQMLASFLDSRPFVNSDFYSIILSSLADFLVSLFSLIRTLRFCQADLYYPLILRFLI